MEIAQGKPRKGLVVAVRGTQIGIRYFKSSVIRGTPADFIWWIHRAHVKIVSSS